MAYQKLQAYRAAAVTPSDTVDIPSISTDPGASKNNGCVLFVGGSQGPGPAREPLEEV